jgi:hypothetical protein
LLEQSTHDPKFEGSDPIPLVLGENSRELKY